MHFWWASSWIFLYFFIFRLILQVFDNLHFMLSSHLPHSVRMNFLRLSRTMEEPRSLWKNKKWSGQIWPCRVCMKTHLTPEAERRIWNLSVEQNHANSVCSCFVFWKISWCKQNQSLMSLELSNKVFFFFCLFLKQVALV